MSDTYKTYHPKGREEWRQWLEKNHRIEIGVWLIYDKAHAGQLSISHSEAIDEALCFGWIDSKGQSIDAQTYNVFY